MCALPEKNKKSAMIEDILRKVHKLSFYFHNLKLLNVRNFFYNPQKTTFDARISSRSNYISKKIFTKNHAIHLILFIFIYVYSNLTSEGAIYKLSKN